MPELTDKKPPDKYKVVKSKLIDIFSLPKTTTKTPDEIKQYLKDSLIYVDSINSAVRRANEIDIKTKMLLRYYILHHYENQLEIPFVDKELIGRIQKSILLPSKGGRPSSDKTKNEIAVFKGIQSLFSDFTLIDGNGLSQILENQNTQIITAYENNIKQHFLYDYINRFINSFFELKSKKKHNKQLFHELLELKNDIRNGTLKCHSKYHSWLNKYRYQIVPFDFLKSYTYDIEINPQKYIKHMLWMNLTLESKEQKLFQVVPLRTDSTPKHIEIDSKAIVQLFKIPNQGIYLDNISKYRKFLWRKYTYVPSKRGKEYFFDYTILTDGYSCSIRYVEKSQKGKVDNIKDKKRKGRQESKEVKNQKKSEKDAVKEKEKIVASQIRKEKATEVEKGKIFKCEKVTKSKENESVELKYKEFLYIDDVDPNTFIDHNDNIVFNDDGKRSLLMMEDKNGKILNYTNREHLKYTKRLKFRRKIEKLKKLITLVEIDENNNATEHSIESKEAELSGFMSKTCDTNKFLEYCNKKLEINKSVLDLYEMKKFRQYKWYGYVNRQRQDTKLVKRIKKTFGEKAIIISGDGSVNPSMRNFISTPNKRLKRKIKEQIKIYSLDEYRTSCLNYKTLQRNVGNLKYKDKDNHTRKLHAVLTYKMEDKRLGCINRDKNATKNMKFIFEHYIGYCKGEKETPRPWRFCRSDKTT